jgi:hypothetical protein
VGPNFKINVTLKAPGGKNLWSEHTGATMKSISFSADQLGEQISNQLFLEIMKVRDKYT